MPFIQHDDLLKESFKHADGVAAYVNSALETGDDEYVRFALQKVKKLAGLDTYEAVKRLWNAQKHLRNINLSLRVEPKQRPASRKVVKALRAKTGS